MDIGAAKAEGTHGCAAYFRSAREGNQLVIENEGAVRERHSWIGRLEMESGGNCLVVQDEGGLDYSLGEGVRSYLRLFPGTSTCRSVVLPAIRLLQCMLPTKR